MPFSRPTLQTIRDRIAADIERHSNGDPHSRGSLEYAITNALSGSSHGLHGLLEFLSKQLFDDSAEITYLERRASVFGIARIAAVVATGTVTITGTDTTLIPAGTELQAADDQLYVTDANGTITGGTVDIAVTALDAGAAGNQTAGALLTFTTPIAGADSQATVAAGGLVNGADAETDGRLRERFAERKQMPPMGGADADYIAWAKQASIDVTRVWVQGNKDAAEAEEFGSVLMYFATDDLSTPIPTAGHVTTVSDYIDQANIRPAGVKNVYVVAPTEKTLDMTFSALTPNTAEVQAAIEAEIKDLLKREAEPGGTIVLSHIREAISLATGEDDFGLTTPNADFTTVAGEIAVLGTITWPGA